MEVALDCRVHIFLPPFSSARFSKCVNRAYATPGAIGWLSLRSEAPSLLAKEGAS